MIDNKYTVRKDCICNQNIIFKNTRKIIDSIKEV